MQGKWDLALGGTKAVPLLLSKGLWTGTIYAPLSEYASDIADMAQLTLTSGMH